MFFESAVVGQSFYFRFTKKKNCSNGIVIAYAMYYIITLRWMFLTLSLSESGAKYIMLQVELTEEEFNENMKNKDSKEFQDIAKKIITQVSHWERV